MLKALADPRIMGLSLAAFFLSLLVVGAGVWASAFFYTRDCMYCVIATISACGAALHWMYTVYASTCSYLLIMEGEGVAVSLKRMLSFPLHLFFAAPLMSAAGFLGWWRLVSSGKQSPRKMRVVLFTDFNMISHSLLFPVMFIEHKGWMDAGRRIGQVLVENYDELRNVSFLFKYAIPCLLGVFFFGLFVLVAFTPFSGDIAIPGFMPSPVILIGFVAMLFVYAQTIIRVSAYSEAYMKTLYMEKAGAEQ